MCERDTFLGLSFYLTPLDRNEWIAQEDNFKLIIVFPHEFRSQIGDRLTCDSESIVRNSSFLFFFVRINTCRYDVAKSFGTISLIHPT